MAVTTLASTTITGSVQQEAVRIQLPQLYDKLASGQLSSPAYIREAVNAIISRETAKCDYFAQKVRKHLLKFPESIAMLVYTTPKKTQLAPALSVDNIPRQHDTGQIRPPIRRTLKPQHTSVFSQLQPPTKKADNKLPKPPKQVQSVGTFPQQPAKQADKTTIHGTEKSWPKVLQRIYKRRLTGEDARADLRQNGKKTKHWSWQWFPSIYRKAINGVQISQNRKDCAFKTINELMAYYRAPALLGPFLELATLAVNCSMKIPVDEQYLLESLMLCQYAANMNNDEKTGRQISSLIKKQKKKPGIDIDQAEFDIGQWIMGQPPQ